MVRAGVVSHPSEWAVFGYQEIRSPRERYALIDYKELAELAGFRSIHAFADSYGVWIDNAVKDTNHRRNEKLGFTN